MHDRPTYKSDSDTARQVGAHPLKSISAAQFAVLGMESVVFLRAVDTETLMQLVPDAQMEGETGPFLMVMSADGRPVLVTDNQEALESWLEERPVSLASVH